jgi:hypothetical protein
MAILVVALLIAKAIRDRRREQSVATARYDAVRELYNKIGPGLDLTTEMALLDPAAEKEKKHELLRNFAAQCCAALVAMIPTAADALATVFQLTASPDEIAPLMHAGRRERPRTFRLNEAEGRELKKYLLSNNPRGELYEDLRQTVPEGYSGDPDRYETFIRTPIYALNVVFGMVAVDAPKARSLNQGDVALVEFIAAELSVAFAIAAS